MTKCLACVGEFIQAKQKANGDGSEAAWETLMQETVEDAITWAPSWVSQIMNGQMIVTAVPAPTCMRHLNTAPASPEQRALGSRLILGGG